MVISYIRRFIRCDEKPFYHLSVRPVYWYLPFRRRCGTSFVRGLVADFICFHREAVCRFLCPYGALLSLFSSVSIWKIRLSRKACINCELCHNSCPVDAIRSPYANKVKESRKEGVRRLLGYLVVLPLMIAAGAFLMRSASSDLSRANKDVRLYDMVERHEANPEEELSLELEAFYGQGRTLEELTSAYEAKLDEFRFYSTIAGGLIGLVIGLALIRLSVKRTRKQYEINHAACVACALCFSYCPQNKNSVELRKSSES